MNLIFCLIGFVLSVQTANAQAIRPKIINGQDADSQDPVSKSTIAIQMPNLNNGVMQYPRCTAFVIKENVLMTAAHCLAFLSDKSGVQAILALAPKFGLDDGKQKRISLSDFRIHPDYYANDSGVYNDVALIKLKESLPSYYQVLNFNWDLDSSLAAGQDLIVAGFGTTIDFEQSDTLPPRLRFTGVPFIGGDKNPFQDSAQLLVDQSKAGFCSGDSGGPLYFQSGMQLTPIGIVSHVTQNSNGNWSCKANGAFTRISFFKSWILQALSELN